MYCNYSIENRAYEEPAAVLFTSDTRKDGIPPPQSGCLGTPLALPQSLYGRTYSDVRTKIFRINGFPNLLTHGAPRAPLPNNSPVLLKVTILVHQNYQQVFQAADGQDGNGLQLEKVSLVSLCLRKVT